MYRTREYWYYIVTTEMSKLLHFIFRVYQIVAGALIALVVLDVVFVLGFPAESLPKAGSPADAVVVLGAAPNSPAIRNRASRGYEVYSSGAANTLVLTGGNTASQDESEAMNMARFLTKQKGTALPLVLEERSANTYENLRNTKQQVPELDTIVIVSDRYHVPRAFVTAKSLGFEHVYWSSPDSSYYLFPELARYYVREMVAMFAYVPKWVQAARE